MVGTPGSSPPRRSRRLRSATSTFGSQSARPYRISSPTHQPLSPTAIAPRLTAAQNVTIHSGQFAARIATRSPGPDPVLLAEHPRDRRHRAPVLGVGDDPTLLAVREHHVVAVAERLRRLERGAQVREPVGEDGHRSRRRPRRWWSRRSRPGRGAAPRRSAIPSGMPAAPVAASAVGSIIGRRLQNRPRRSRAARTATAPRVTSVISAQTPPRPDSHRGRRTRHECAAPSGAGRGPPCPARRPPRGHFLLPRTLHSRSARAETRG